MIGKMEKLSSSEHLSRNLVNEENNKDLLEAQAQIWNQIFNFINSMSLKCAIELGIPDTIQSYGKPMSLSQLVAALPIHQEKAPCVYRLMRILIHSGFFVDQEEGYVLTDTSKLLLKDNPSSMRPFLLNMLDPIMTKPWDFQSNWIRNEKPTPFETAHGMSLWDYGGHQPEWGNFFNEAMASDARFIARVMINDHKCKGVFEGLDSLVDIGGGTGTVAKSIAASFPQIQCIVLDLPHVVANMQGTNNSLVETCMFDAIPHADAVLLKWILHNWSDKESVKLLKKCKEAITKKEDKKGKVTIIDMVINHKPKDDDNESYETQLFFDMLLMVLLTGRERNEKEWANLFYDAGFNNYKITPILGLRSLIEVYP